MTPQKAYFLQARSDLMSAIILEEHGDTCQCILHLQMSIEKLLKGYYHMQEGVRPGYIHDAVNRYFDILEFLILNDVRRRKLLMGKNSGREATRRVLGSMRTSMERIEALNPSVSVRLDRSVSRGGAPNCEYPWESNGTWHTPVRYRFGSAVGSAARAKLYRFLDRLLNSERA